MYVSHLNGTIFFSQIIITGRGKTTKVYGHTHTFNSEVKGNHTKDEQTFSITIWISD